MTMRSIPQFAALFSLALGACDGDPSGPEDRSLSAPTRSHVVTPPVQAVQAVPSSSWRERLDADLLRIRQARPELVARVEGLTPTRTRAGFVRFTEGFLADPEVCPLVLDRILRAQDPLHVQLALADLLPRTHGSFGEAVAWLISNTAELPLRIALTDVLGKSPGPAAVDALAGLLQDPEAKIRITAARSLRQREDIDGLVGPLLTALTDPEAELRVEAARALGNLAKPNTADALALLAADPNPSVRLHGLRALHRSDPARGLKVALEQALASDPDPKVSALAQRIAEGG